MVKGAVAESDRFRQAGRFHPPERLALVLGTEGDGLARRTVEAADLVVRIPMGGGVDSLNVAAASAVAFWAVRPRGTPGAGPQG